MTEIPTPEGFTPAAQAGGDGSSEHRVDRAAEAAPAEVGISSAGGGLAGGDLPGGWAPIVHMRDGSGALRRTEAAMRYVPQTYTYTIVLPPGTGTYMIDGVVLNGGDTLTLTDQTIASAGLRVRTAAEQEDYYRRERERHERAMAEYTARVRAERAERDARTKAAYELLYAHLSPLQALEANQDKRFEVRSNYGRRWVIRMDDGVTGNVALLDAEDTPLAHYCAHGAGSMPNPEHWLAQKLTLEADEDLFLATAHVYHVEGARFADQLPNQSQAATRLRERGMVRAWHHGWTYAHGWTYP